MIHNNYSINNVINKRSHGAVKPHADVNTDSDEQTKAIKKTSAAFSNEMVRQKIDLSEQPSNLSAQQEHSSEQRSSEQQSTAFSLAITQNAGEQDNLRYDQPSALERGAISTYQQVAQHSQREQIMESMSFHFVV